MASALGMSAAAVYGFAGITRPAFAQNARRGGTFRIELQDFKDPQNFEWIIQHCPRRLRIARYSADAVVEGYLAESWKVSADGKTFDISCARASSGATAMNSTPMMSSTTSAAGAKKATNPCNNSEWASGVMEDPEKVNSHHIRLHLTKPDVTVAHRLFAYPTCIVHRSFDDTGADLTKNAIGTPLTWILTSRAICQTLAPSGLLGRTRTSRAMPIWTQVIFVDLGEDPQAPRAMLDPSIHSKFCGSLKSCNGESMRKVPPRRAFGQMPGE